MTAGNRILGFNQVMDCFCLACNHRESGRGEWNSIVCETVENQANEVVPDDPWILENEQRRAAGKYRRVVQMRRRVESAKGGRESIERATPCGCGRAVKSSAFARVITP
jgi:hypothetical protein